MRVCVWFVDACVCVCLLSVWIRLRCLFCCSLSLFCVFFVSCCFLFLIWMGGGWLGGGCLCNPSKPQVPRLCVCLFFPFLETWGHAFFCGRGCLWDGSVWGRHQLIIEPAKRHGSLSPSQARPDVHIYIYTYSYSQHTHIYRTFSHGSNLSQPLTRSGGEAGAARQCGTAAPGGALPGGS